jgi:DNA-binding transcriptional LysR family regulator
MDTRHIRAAVVVAQTGSFTAAAAELYMAQSTVSRQVAALEKQLGGPLFARGPRSVALTARGVAFIPHAERILSACDTAERAAKEASNQREPAPRLGRRP